MSALGLQAFPVATQTCSRRQDWSFVTLLAGIGMTLYRLAFDLRLLQSPPIGEWSEPFAAQQVGSSAMPFKRNPVNAENIDSLARYLAALPRVGLGQRRPQPAGTHARRLRQSPHHPAPGQPVLRGIAAACGTHPGRAAP